MTHPGMWKISMWQHVVIALRMAWFRIGQMFGRNQWCLDCSADFEQGGCTPYHCANIEDE